MATITGMKTVFQLAVDMTHNAMDVAYLHRAISECEIMAHENPTQESLIDRLIDIFNMISRRRERLESMNREISSLRDVLPSYFRHPFETIVMPSFHNAKEIAFSLVKPIVDAQHQLIVEQFQMAIEKLNAFRKNPLKRNLLSEVECKNLILFDRIKNIQELGTRCRVLTQNDTERMDELASRSIRLSKILALQQPRKIGYLFACLDQLIEDPSQFSSDFITGFYAQFDGIINNMSKESIEELDDMILKHESTLDNLEGKMHRYDDLAFFKQAITTVIRNQFERIVADEIPPEQLNEFYQMLFEEAFGPKDEDSQNWARAELPSLSSIVSKTFQRFVFKKIGVEVCDSSSSEFSEDEDKALDPLGITNNNALTSTANSLSPKVEQLNLLLQKISLVFEESSVSEGYDSSSSEFSENTKNENKTFLGPLRVTCNSILALTANNPFPEVGRLNLLLKKINIIEELAESGPNFRGRIDRDTVKRVIVGTLSSKMLGSLYGMIAYLAPDDYEGKGGWGEKHCADDISRLRRAISYLKDPNLLFPRPHLKTRIRFQGAPI